MAYGRYKLARNPLGTVPDAPLDSNQGKEFHPPILRNLEIQGGQVKRERDTVYHIETKPV